MPTFLGALKELGLCFPVCAPLQRDHGETFLHIDLKVVFCQQIKKNTTIVNKLRKRFHGRAGLMYQKIISIDGNALLNPFPRSPFGQSRENTGCETTPKKRSSFTSLTNPTMNRDSRRETFVGNVIVGASMPFMK